MGAFDDLIPEQSNPFDDLIPAPKAPKNPILGGTGAFASGVNRAVLAGLPGIPADTALNILDLLKASIGTSYGELTGKTPPEFLDPTNRANVPLTSAWFARQVGKVPGGEAVISSDAAEYPGLHAAGQAAGSTVGSKTPMRAATIAGGAGLIGQKVGEATGSNEAAILANLLAAPTLAQARDIRRLSPFHLFDPAARQAAVALRPYTKEQIERGIDLQHSASIAGNPISPAQALGGAGRVVDLENRVLDSQYAPRHLLQQAQSQPERSARFAGDLSRVAGKPDYSLGRANVIESAAEAGLAMPKEMARKQAQPYYDFLKETRPQLPENARWSIAGQLEKLNKTVGLLEDSYAGQAVSDVAKTVTKDSLILRPTKGKVPFRRAEGGIYELDNYLKEVSSRIENLSTLGADAKQSVERAGLRPALTTIKQELLANSPELAKAKETYHTTRSTLEDVVRTTGIADMARRPDADLIKKPAANWNTLTGVLNRKQAPDDLRRTDTILGRTDPNAMQQIIANKFDELRAKHFTGDNVSPAAPVNFVRDVRNIPNLDTAVEIAAQRNGAPNPKRVSQGFRVALDILEASGLERGMPSGGQTAAKAAAISPERSAATLAFGHGLAQRATILRNIQEVMNRHEIQKMSKVLDSPDSLKQLSDLAALEPTSARAKKIVREIFSPPGDLADITLRSLLPVTYQRGLLEP